MSSSTLTKQPVSTGLEDEAPVTEVIVKAYSTLATAPSRIVTATVEDAFLALIEETVPA